MQSYHHFTQSERNCLAQMQEAGKSYREIGKALGKNTSSICRELQRNGQKGQQYHPQDAFVLYCLRRRKCIRRYRLDKHDALRTYVEEKLAQFWSPAAIAGRWNWENDASERLSASTIYRTIHDGRLAGYSARTHLRRRGIPYKPTRSRYYAIQPEHTIRELPTDAVYRKTIGHWEGDTICGCRGSGGLLSLIDRKSRLCVLRIIPDMSAATMARAMVAALGNLPVHSVLLDNGSEFAKHRKIAASLHTCLYFADPHSPWQRGSNENCNGRVRFFFPKGTDMKHLDPQQVAYVELLLNNRPLRCLDWLTPREVFASRCCT